ncbi:hypothetical protein JKP88DRAFT_227373 [Tribonema minus]|uniref:Protein kinase domain-containing protein n=1 Tax=Tribonema minus TaxID=303371 RepID=A0A835YLV1_9STRA|nr:hypothetical protein JKP88DRAFT_227373 [Tribonema minus]
MRKEEQLREEKAKLLDRQAMPSPDVSGILKHFTQLLQQTHISRPNARVLDLIQRRFSSRLMTAATPEHALSLYMDAQLLPGTSTSYILIADYSLQLNGPFSEELPACILTATDRAGRPCIVKLLGRSESTSIPPTGRQTEADVCTQLHLAEANLAGIPVVHATLLEVALQGLEQNMQATKKHGPGVYRALLMPRYACVVSDQPQLTEQAILQGAERLVEAIKYIHGKGYVHMDIKASNVFVDADGRWFLGDFGATLPAGDLVFAYTEWFHRDKTLKGRPAQVAFDWYMLAVMLAAELHKKDWQEQLLAGDRVSDSKLRAAATVATLGPLREILEVAMEDGQVGGVEPA